MVDIPFKTFMSLYFVSLHIILTNSHASTSLKMNMEGSNSQSSSSDLALKDDSKLKIVLSAVQNGQTWTKKETENHCKVCERLNDTFRDFNAGPSEVKSKEMENKTTDPYIDEVLDCGKPVNFTFYDNLVGVINRLTHPNIPEPQLALIFKKNVTELDVDALERKLKKAKREKPKSVLLYNQIGNFWRIKGDTYKSIECFRRALAVSPQNAEVLLNLARVLYNLQYLDDAIYLTRRSLEVQPPDKSAWQQYFTLGEIFKAYGHYQEASLHMRHCLQLNPGFDPAVAALKEMETIPNNAIHVYTLLIIICLVLCVLMVIVSSVETNLEPDYVEVKGHQCHFNRTMAISSLKVGFAPRTMRYKRYSDRTG